MKYHTGAGSIAWVLQVGRTRHFLRTLTVLVGIGCMILLCYFPALRVYFLSDDYVLLTQAKLTASLLTVFAPDPDWWFYRPLGRFVWWVMYHVWGYRGAAYHLLSLGLHWVNSLLVIALVTQFRPGSPWIAPLAGICFALLPLHVETVVWLACQYDLLATAWYLVTLLCLLLAWQRWNIGLYLLSLGTFQLSLWSKEIAFTLPMMVLVCGLLLRERPRLLVIGASVLPYAVLVGVNLMQRYLTWGTLGGYAVDTEPGILTLWKQPIASLFLLMSPLNQLLFPDRLIQIWFVAMAGVLLAGLISRWHWRLIGLALLWLVITQIPVLTILPVNPDLQNSRLLYLPAVGFCIGLAAAFDGFIRRFVRSYAQQVTIGGVALFIGAAAIVIVIQVQPWLVAGQQTIHVVQELHRLRPGFAPNTKLQVAGIPDNYQGAYIYRLGLDHSFGHHYNATFKLETVPTLSPLSYEHGGDSFQVAFNFDRSHLRWEIIHMLGVTFSTNDDAITADGALAWDFADCTTAQEWPGSSKPLTCEQEVGLHITPAQALLSPPLDLQASSWVEVMVQMSVPDGNAGNSVAQLHWNTTVDQEWSDRHLMRINIPPTERRHTYHFFVPPDRAGHPLRQIQFDPGVEAGPVTVHEVRIRPIP